MYELLIERAAAGFNIRTGQTLTPRPFVSAIMDCVLPTPEDRIFDPAAGTGPFLLGAYESLERLGARVDPGMLAGRDLDERMCRLALMNLLLRTDRPFTDPPPLEISDSLSTPDRRQPTLIMCNPPFRSTAPQPVGRSDFLVTTSVIQINFLQHIAHTLAVGGRAAVFVPDNVLFARGAAGTVREWLLRDFDVHTLLRLPTGVFDRGGVKTNVLFFEKKPPRPDGVPATKQLWIYDLRTGQDFAARQRPLRRTDLDDFVSCFRPSENREHREKTGQFHPFDFAALAARNFNLDITPPQDGSTEAFGDPGEIAQEIEASLAAATRDFAELAESLGGNGSLFRIVDTANPVNDVVQMVIRGELDAGDLAQALQRENNAGQFLSAFTATAAGASASETAVIQNRRKTIERLKSSSLIRPRQNPRSRNSSGSATGSSAATMSESPNAGASSCLTSSTSRC